MGKQKMTLERLLLMLKEEETNEEINKTNISFYRNVYELKKTEEEKIDALAEFLAQRYSESYVKFKNSRNKLRELIPEEIIKKATLTKHFIERQKETLSKEPNKRSRKSPSSTKASEYLFNKHKHLPIREMAIGIVKDIPSIYGANIKTSQNFIRWLNSKKPLEDKKLKELISSIKDEWNKVDWGVAEKEVRDSFGGWKQKGSIASKSISSLDGGRRDVSLLRRALLEGDTKKIDTEFNILLNKTDYVKSDVYYSSAGAGKIDKKPIHLEVKNISTTGGKIDNKILRGEKIAINRILFAKFIDFRVKNNAKSKAQFDNLVKYINKNKKILNEKLDDAVKKQIKDSPGHIRNFIVLKDVKYKNDFDLRINLRKEIDKLKFYFSVVDGETNKRVDIGLNINNLGKENLYSYREAIERNRRRGLIERKLLLFKKLLTEGMNTSYI